MLLAVILSAFLKLLGPLALKELLGYLEPGGAEKAKIRPWVWVLSLLVAPALGGIVMQWYGFVGSRMLARIQAIITQLILEHSLRLRMREETSHTSVTADTERVHSHERTGGRTPPRTKNTQYTSHLIGQMNNLITTDVENVSETRDRIGRFRDAGPLGALTEAGHPFDPKSSSGEDEEDG
ncbi:hypothetical protein AAF712_004403 [Marasmius tenuissimus]|uniref:ABC transmembrane type-1 domain-containing protein n=1 Tax=Marasmius tenuissimus TaxID=585030 RepID=A0ABR3A3Y5_9AGAR